MKSRLLLVVVLALVALLGCTNDSFYEDKIGLKDDARFAVIAGEVESVGGVEYFWLNNRTLTIWTYQYYSFSNYYIRQNNAVVDGEMEVEFIEVRVPGEGKGPNGPAHTTIKLKGKVSKITFIQNNKRTSYKVKWTTDDVWLYERSGDDFVEAMLLEDYENMPPSWH